MFEHIRKSSLLVVPFLIFLTTLTAQAGILSPELQSILPSLTNQDEISVIITLSDRPNAHLIKDQDRRLLRSRIISHLKEKTDLTQRPVKTFLETRGARKIKSLWLINGLALTATANVIQELADLPEVELIRLDKPIQAPVITYGTSTLPEWNIAAIQAPDLWDIGFTGQGVVIASMDTGVDYLHPDLNSKWRGGINSWYDPHGQHTTPYDASGHGTQTMGIMVGGSEGGTAIGVAPDAKWIAVKMFNDAGNSSLSIIHQGFQWLLDPDDNPDTDDAPDVVNNSWGLSGTENQCVLEFETDIQTLRAAGIAVVFAAGNSGPGSQTSVSPANNPESIAVGSIDQSLNIALDSSRGPSACGGSIYPTLVAPGVNVRTSDLTSGGVIPNSYKIVSGTSFSAPHVAGAMALLLDAFPNMSVSKLEWSLKYSALDLGPSDADNTYGYGLVDVLRAYSNLRSALLDFDGDGLSDLAGITLGGNIFYTTDLQTWVNIPGALSQMVVGDFDGDGLSDLAGLASDGSIWGSTDLLTWTNIPGALSQMVVGNFNGDVSSDLAGLASDGSIWYTTNLSAWSQIPGALSQLVVGDFNGNGSSDLAGLASDGSIWVSTDLSVWTQIPGALSQMVVGDFDGDGLSDLAGLASDGSIWYTTNLSAWTNIPGALSQLVEGDFNGDGLSDLAGLTSAGNVLYTIDLLTWINIPGALTQLVVGDFNGNGSSDLAGPAFDGTIFYTTDLQTWTQIPGVLDKLVE